MKDIQFRKWRSLDEDAFLRDLCELSNLSNNTTDVDSLVHYFSDTLTGVIEKHVPLKTKKITYRPEVPWYSLYLRELKKVRRMTEQIRMKNKLDISELVYKKIKNQYTAAIASAQMDYYCGRIQEADGNSKKLYNVISDLLGRIQQNPLPSHVNDKDLANEFSDFLIDKVVNPKAGIGQCSKSQCYDL